LYTKKKKLLTELHIRITLLNYPFNSINKKEDAAKWCNCGNIMQKLQQGLRKLTTLARFAETFFVKQATSCTKYVDFHKILYFSEHQL